MATEKKSNNNTLLIVLGGAVLLGGGYYIMTKKEAATAAPIPTAPTGAKDNTVNDVLSVLNTGVSLFTTLFDKFSTKPTNIR